MREQDTQRRPYAEFFGYFLVQRQESNIILLHDMSMTSVQAALDIVDALQEQGFRFVTASELAKLRKTAIKPGAVYRNFPPEEDSMK